MKYIWSVLSTALPPSILLQLVVEQLSRTKREGGDADMTKYSHIVCALIDALFFSLLHFKLLPHWFIDFMGR